MVKITVPDNCGNSPKSAFIRDFVIAMAQQDRDYIVERVTDDMHWQLVGNWDVEGVPEFTRALDALQSKTVAELVIDRVITHGRDGAANGEMTLENGRHFAFCHMVGFKGAKGAVVKSLISYVIEQK